MKQRKKLLFMTRGKGIIDLFWGPRAEAKAEELGFEVDMPARNGDIPDFDFIPILADYDGLITSWNSPVCNAELLCHAPNVKVIGHSAGSVAAVVDNSTYQFPVRVFTANYVMAEAVAEWSLLATMLAARDFWKYAQWKNATHMEWGGMEQLRDLTKLTVGIWGMGDVTRPLLRMFQVLRFNRILVASTHSTSEELAALGAEKATFEEVFSQSDIIHCLVGANKENLYRVSKKELASIRNGATLINCGRAKLIHEASLLEALAENRFTAILDVFHDEPLAEDSPLRKMENVILTPHNAGYTGRDRYVPFLLEDFDRAFRGMPTVSEISEKRYQTMTNETIR